MPDIVERLRRGEQCEGNQCRTMEASSGCTCAEAADEIERLRAENERLRADVGGMNMEPRLESDIVERLRNKDWMWSVPGALREESANEIERLRQERDEVNGPICKRCQGHGRITFETTYHGERSEFSVEQCPDCKGTGRELRAEIERLRAALKDRGIREAT